MHSHCRVFCHRGLPDIDPKRELLHFARGPNRHRELAAALQHDQAARIARIQVASTVCPCLRRVAGCATPTGSAGHASATACLKLTFHLDHSVGTNQLALCEHLPGSVAVDTHRTVDDDANTLFERRKAVVG